MSTAIQYDYCEVGESLVEKLHLHVQRGESFVLLGYQGAGKRQAIERLARRLDEEKRPYLAVWFQDTVSVVTETDLLDVLKRRIKQVRCEHIVALLEGATSLQDWFRRLGQGNNLAIGFANIDLLAQSLKERFLALIRTAVENRDIVVCLTGESMLARTLGGDSSPWQCTYQYVLTAHDKDTARKFFLKRVRFCGLKFHDPKYPSWNAATAFEEFYEHTGGNLNLLRALLWWLSEQQLRFDQDPERHPGFPRSIVRRSFLDYTAVPLFGLRIFHSVIIFIQQERSALARVEELLDQVQTAWDVGQDLRTACLGASVPVESDEPEPLELAGFLRRNLEKKRLFFPSFYVAEFVNRYFSWTCRGDFHAKQGDWDEAFKCYQNVEARERRMRPLGEQDFRIVRTIVNRLCREFAERITEADATTRLRQLWEQCGRLLFGLKSAVVLRLNDSGNWVVEPEGGSDSNQFDETAKRLLESTPILSPRKEPDETYGLHRDDAKRVMLIQARPETSELKPRHALFLEAEADGPVLDGLQLRVLETAATNFLTCYNEARLRQRMWRSRLRLGEAMKHLFAHTTSRESLEALGQYLHDEFLATGARLFLIDNLSGRLHSTKSWGFKDLTRQEKFDSGGFVLPTEEDAALREHQPIAFRWHPAGSAVPPPTTDLPFRDIATGADADEGDRKVGDYWIDFPLFVGEEPYGKLTLDFSSDASPPARYLDDLNVISAILSSHLKRLKLDEAVFAEMRDLQRKAVGLVAHDLGARISDLPSFLERYDVFADSLKGPLREEITQINKEFQEGLDSAKAILQLAQQRLKEIRPDYREVDLVAVVRKALRPISRAGGSVRTEIIKPEADGKIMIDADEFHIGGIFSELVSDSQTMQRDGTAVQVRVRIDRRVETNKVVIDYTDNGPGVPDKLKERIFDYLISYRPGQAREGLGLGLDYVRTTIQAHGGSIEEIGQYGRGVRFQITLPIRQQIP